jgi:predicted nucleic acid-binding protein
MSSSSETHCLDANIVLRFMGQAEAPAVEQLWQVWLAARPRIVAPTVLRYELVNTLHRWVRHGVMTTAEAGRALAEAQALPIEMHGDDALHERALELASRFSLPAAYDAHYLALAERFGAPLWTTDRRLANAVGDSLPEVRLVD